jgi:NDP-sugar pyrophosphorylase family protein
MRRILLMMMVMAATISAHAYDYPYLTLQTADGMETSVAVDELVLTISNGQLVATNGDGTVSITLSDLSKMYFSTSSSDILTAVTAFPDPDGQVEVYTTGGVLVGRYDSMATAKSKLRSGVYVMKTNEKSFKTVVR